MAESTLVMSDLVHGLCAEVLGRADIDPAENFFTLGGNSLLAVRLSARITAATGVRVPARLFYEGSSMAELARTVADLQVGLG